MTENEQLREENRRLREALEPFAEAYKKYRYSARMGPGPHNYPTYADFEKAEAALAPAVAGEGEKVR